jgi:hypothetical protein
MLANMGPYESEVPNLQDDSSIEEFFNTIGLKQNFAAP